MAEQRYDADLVIDQDVKTDLIKRPYAWVTFQPERMYCIDCLTSLDRDPLGAHDGHHVIELA